VKFLADTSAWTNVYRSEDVWSMWSRHMQAQHVGTCTPVQLELLRGTRNRAEYHRTRIALGALHDVPITPEAWHRALDVLDLLEAKGAHRGVALADLVVSAAAELAEVVVLHYDKDFDLIASVTKQQMQWIAPRGSLGD
jgi:hypothetical protein